KAVPIIPTIVGRPPDGYESGQVLLRPNTVDVEGPESRVMTLSSIATVPIRLDHRQTTLEQTFDLDVPDPQIRIQHPSPVSVKVCSSVVCLRSNRMGTVAIDESVITRL